MSNAIAITGTLDTKEEDIDFIKNRIQERRDQVMIVDTGILDESKLALPNRSEYLAPVEHR